MGNNRKYTQEIENAIVAQLECVISAADVVSHADRKQRLLRLFYNLGSSYFGSTYRDRLASPHGGRRELSRSEGRSRRSAGD